MRNRYTGTGRPGFHPLRKMRIATRGMIAAVFMDFAVAYKTAVSLALLLGCFVYREWLDVGVVLVATGLVLVAEILNTAIEAMCDFVHAEHSERIALVKDIAAAAVGVSILVWTLVVVFQGVRIWQAMTTG